MYRCFARLTYCTKYVSYNFDVISNLSFGRKYSVVLNNFTRFKYSLEETYSSVHKYRLSTSLGFSLFTWLGLIKKPSEEDELIDTIRHSVLFIQRKEYDKAEQLLHVALRQAQQTSHDLGITYIYDVLANLALEREHLDKAKKLFITVAQRLMTDGISEDDLRIVHISIKLARISHLKKDYDVAQIGYDWCLNKLNNAYAKDPTESITKLVAQAEDWYGRLYLDCNQNEHALNLMLRALDHILQLKDMDEDHIVIQLNDIGTVYERIGKLDESIEYYTKAIERGKHLDMDDLGALYVNLGKVYIKQNLLDKARKNCGYGWRLGHDRKNEQVKKQAGICIKEINDLN